ncbi:MAG: GTPase [Steroidobacteraceae bacterium]
MPANLSPEYRNAEQAFRAAREARERLDCLKEMLRTIPKHKGTERIQADIKSRIKQFSDELIGPRKGPAPVGSAHSVHREGAAQVGLIGPPNSGKSSLHAILTGSRAEIGPFPYTTRAPPPGMLTFEDIAFQLVDLPNTECKCRRCGATDAQLKSVSSIEHIQAISKARMSCQGQFGYRLG